MILISCFCGRTQANLTDNQAEAIGWAHNKNKMLWRCPFCVAGAKISNGMQRTSLPEPLLRSQVPRRFLS